MKLVSDLSLYETLGHEMESLQCIGFESLSFFMVYSVFPKYVPEGTDPTGIMLK